MSMYRGENFGNYRMREPLPAWMKNERYEYCEPFEHRILFENFGEKRPLLAQFIMSMLL